MSKQQAKDEPTMRQESPVKALEREAIAAYRAKYPDGPLWQDLHVDTRVMWMKAQEHASKSGLGDASE
jgi:hypothetical protein